MYVSVHVFRTEAYYGQKMSILRCVQFKCHIPKYGIYYMYDAGHMWEVAAVVESSFTGPLMTKYRSLVLSIHSYRAGRAFPGTPHLPGLPLSTGL